MTTDLQIFDFKIISYKDKQPKLVDWDFLKIEKDSDKINQQHTRYSVIVQKAENGHNVTVEIKIGIPCHIFQNVPVGAFQYYEGQTTYFISVVEKPIASVIGELVLNHFGKMSSAIMIHTFSLTSGKNHYSIQPPCLSKVILLLENLE